MKLTHKLYLAKGKRGIAYTALLGKKKVLLKEHNPTATVDTIAYEADMLKLVNKVGVGPHFIAYNNGQLVREFIEGEQIVKWITQTKIKAVIKKVLLDILDQCYAMDKLKINKLEMTHPHKHILVRRNKPIMIDFDRAKRTLTLKNVTQVCQWFTNKELSLLLSSKDIMLPREEILKLAKIYKESYAPTDYKNIRGLIRDG